MSHLATQLGHHPQVILAGRETNDGMGRWIADRLHERRKGRAGSALVLGLTFKENVSDLRNSRTFDLIRRLEDLGHQVAVADPLADPAEVGRDHRLTLVEPGEQRFDLVVGAVAHHAYRQMDAGRLKSWSARAGRWPTSRACGARWPSTLRSTGGRCDPAAA